MMEKSFRYSDIILALFVVALIVSNISATKLVAFGPIIADGGAVLFPLIYILGDILTEVYGFRYAKRAIFAGFVAMIIAVVCFWIVGNLPAAADYTDQASFQAVLGFLPRIVIASLAAYLIGSLVNAFVMARLKLRTKGKKLWLRLIGSTVVGELLDTVVFAVVAFGGILSAPDMLKFILIGWMFKTGVEVVLLPVTYNVIAWLRKQEQVA